MGNIQYVLTWGPVGQSGELLNTHKTALAYLILHLKVFPFPPGLAGRNLPLQTQLFQDGPMAQRNAYFTH